MEQVEKRLTCGSSRYGGRAVKIRLPGAISMLVMFRKTKPAIRTLRGWAISVLLEAGAILECEEHGWMMDRGDPDARERAISVARQDPPFRVSPEEAVAAIEDVLGSIGDTCPECPQN
jgi:hypothetical protein